MSAERFPAFERLTDDVTTAMLVAEARRPRPRPISVLGALLPVGVAGPAALAVRGARDAGGRVEIGGVGGPPGRLVLVERAGFVVRRGPHGGAGNGAACRRTGGTPARAATDP